MLQARYFKWLPNAITCLRIAGGAVAMALAANEAWVAALWVYLASLLSDFLDGLAAKKLHAGTKLGEMLDSFADGWLVAAGLIGLSAAGQLSWWVTVAVIAVGFSVQIERRVLHGRLAVPAEIKKMFAITCLFAAWIYIVLSMASLAYGWSWWYAVLAAVVLVVSGSLKRHRVRTWLRGRS